MYHKFTGYDEINEDDYLDEIIQFIPSSIYSESFFVKYVSRDCSRFDTIPEKYKSMPSVFIAAAKNNKELSSNVEILFLEVCKNYVMQNSDNISKIPPEYVEECTKIDGFKWSIDSFFTYQRKTYDDCLNFIKNLLENSDPVKDREELPCEVINCIPKKFREQEEIKKLIDDLFIKFNYDFCGQFRIGSCSPLVLKVLKYDKNGNRIKEKKCGHCFVDVTDELMKNSEFLPVNGEEILKTLLKHNLTHPHFGKDSIAQILLDKLQI